MIIHLTGSSRNLNEDFPYMKKIAEIIQSRGIILARNWIDPAHIRTADKGIPGEVVDWEYIVREDIAAMDRADAVIIEGSSYSFSQGYQTAHALILHKPTLLISRSRYFGRYISGIDNPFFKTRYYSNKTDIEAIITDFLAANLK